MSGEATGWVYKHSPYTGAAFAVHLAMADVVNDVCGNEFWAANATLCAKARVGRQRCNEVLAQMVDEGYLEVIERPPRGTHAPVRYRFLMPAGSPVVFDGSARAVAMVSPEATPGVAVDDMKVSSEATQSLKKNSKEHTRETPSNEQPDLSGGGSPTTSSSVRVESKPTTDSDFDRWYSEYPHKVDKPAARRAFARARKHSGISPLVQGLARWVAHWTAAGTPKDKIPYPATWLNGERWNDDPPPLVRSNGNGRPVRQPPPIVRAGEPRVMTDEEREQNRVFLRELKNGLRT